MTAGWPEKGQLLGFSRPFRPRAMGTCEWCGLVAHSVTPTPVEGVYRWLCPPCAAGITATPDWRVTADAPTGVWITTGGLWAFRSRDWLAEVTR